MCVCVCVCVCARQMMPHTLQKNVKSPKYNALQGHMLPLVKILWVWKREKEKEWERREKGHFWVAMLPTYLWLSLHYPQVLLFFLLSFNLTFPLHLLFHTHSNSLSLSPGVRMRVGHRGDLRALQPLSARCVCKKGGACKENSNYSFI